MDEGRFTGKRGVSYLGDPPLSISPVLKPSKHVLFDTVRLKPSGQHEETLFFDRIKFPSGDPKEFGVDCNIASSGCLGVPLMFDLVMWSIVFERFGSGEDIRQILSKMKLGLILASQGPVVSTVGSEFYPGLILTDGFGRDWITAKKESMRSAPRNYRKTVKVIRGEIGKAAKVGTWTHWYQMLDVGRKARRIDSTSLLGVQAAIGVTNLSAPAQFKVGLHGILYGL